MRINKYLADCELGSRRSVEQFITSGKVTVNGVVVTNLSAQINEGDKVCFNGKQVNVQNTKVYIMLNKPKAYLSSTVNEDNKISVLKLIKEVKQKIYPVGRLDYNTEGLLLLTNDGEFANQIISPKNEIEKEYVVVFKPQPQPKQLKVLTSGMVIEGYKTKPAIISDVTKNNDGTFSLNIIIHEGRNRQIRKMFELVDLKILALKRIRIGNLQLGNLKTGEYKLLNKNEQNKIFN